MHKLDHPGTTDLGGQRRSLTGLTSPNCRSSSVPFASLVLGLRTDGTNGGGHAIGARRAKGDPRYGWCFPGYWDGRRLPGRRVDRRQFVGYGDHCGCHADIHGFRLRQASADRIEDQAKGNDDPANGDAVRASRIITCGRPNHARADFIASARRWCRVRGELPGSRVDQRVRLRLLGRGAILGPGTGLRRGTAVVPEPARGQPGPVVRRAGAAGTERVLLPGLVGYRDRHGPV